MNVELTLSHTPFVHPIPSFFLGEKQGGLALTEDSSDVRGPMGIWMLFEFPHPEHTPRFSLPILWCEIDAALILVWIRWIATISRKPWVLKFP